MIYISNGGFKKLSAKDSVSLLIKEGFDNIELSGGAFAPDTLSELLKIKKRCNFTIHNYFPPPENPFVLNLASQNSEILAISLRHCEIALEWANKLESPVYAVHAGFLIDPKVSQLGKKIEKSKTQNRIDSIDIFVESIMGLEKLAKRYGVQLLVENNVLSHANLEEFGENPLLMVESYEICKIMELLPGVKLLLDVAHLKVSCNSLKLNNQTEIINVEKYIGGYHFSDNDGLRDTNEGFTENAWFLKKISKNILYSVIEVYNSTTHELLKMIKLIEAQP
jgi:sugar phosphate isomerase/epimerase